MLLNMDQGQRGIHGQGANRNVPQKDMLLNMTTARLNFKLQGAILNVPQEEMLLNSLKDIKMQLLKACTGLGFRV